MGNPSLTLAAADSSLGAVRVVTAVHGVDDVDMEMAVDGLKEDDDDGERLEVIDVDAAVEELGSRDRPIEIDASSDGGSPSPIDDTDDSAGNARQSHSVLRHIEALERADGGSAATAKNVPPSTPVILRGPTPPAPPPYTIFQRLGFKYRVEVNDGAIDTNNDLPPPPPPVPLASSAVSPRRPRAQTGPVTAAIADGYDSEMRVFDKVCQGMRFTM